ncbi:Ribosomal RNA-processing protein 7-like A [Spatholobus suberectus]|nr:Ribosomal RNA-processing protein 7-like A [Spatholobus suberectus]
MDTMTPILTREKMERGNGTFRRFQRRTKSVCPCGDCNVVVVAKLTERETKKKKKPSEIGNHLWDKYMVHFIDYNVYVEFFVMMKVKRGKRDTHTGEKKKKRNREQNGDVETNVTMQNVEVDNGNQVRETKKEKASINKKRKNKDKSLVRKRRPKGEEVDLEEQNDGVVDNCHSKVEVIQDLDGQRDSDTGAVIKPCRSKKDKKKRKKEVRNSLEKGEGYNQEEVYIISSGDDDCSKGMKKWIMEYHQSRPGLEVLQHQIDDFITAHEAKLEEERKEKEALAAEGGWTVVVHHKGRKKTTDSESGIAVGSVAQAAVENKMGKKKRKEVGLDFYRFQKREAQRNEIMTLQSKFDEDKKRLQQMRAARKFRPY